MNDISRAHQLLENGRWPTCARWRAERAEGVIGGPCVRSSRGCRSRCRTTATSGRPGGWRRHPRPRGQRSRDLADPRRGVLGPQGLFGTYYVPVTRTSPIRRHPQRRRLRPAGANLLRRYSRPRPRGAVPGISCRCTAPREWRDERDHRRRLGLRHRHRPRGHAAADQRRRRRRHRHRDDETRAAELHAGRADERPRARRAALARPRRRRRRTRHRQGDRGALRHRHGGARRRPRPATAASTAATSSSSPAASCAAHREPVLAAADRLADGVIDGSDLAVLASNFGKTELPAAVGERRASRSVDVAKRLNAASVSGSLAPFCAERRSAPAAPSAGGRARRCGAARRRGWKRGWSSRQGRGRDRRAANRLGPPAGRGDGSPDEPSEPPSCTER